MNTNESVAALESVGVVRVPYPDGLRDEVKKAVAAWKKFCGLEEEIKARFPYDAGEGMGVGYELKKLAVAGRDLKEDFHVTAGAGEWLAGQAAALGNKEAMNFVGGAGRLIDLLVPTIIDFAGQVEKEFSLAGFAEDIAANKDQWFLRFIHYFGEREAENEIAAPHADKSGFTLHLYESDPGLEYLNFEKQWKAMPVGAKETVIIPGMRLQYRSEGRLRAIYHRVVATEKTARDGRFSVVCFVHPANTPQYDKQKAGRLQEFSPGFNYGMPFEEFAKLFK